MPCKHFTAHRAFLLLLLNGLLDGGEPELAYVLILEVWVLQMLSPVSCLNSASSRDPVERSNLSWVRPCGLPHRFLRRGPFRPAQHLAGVRKLDARYSSRREPPCMIPTKGTHPLRIPSGRWFNFLFLGAGDWNRTNDLRFTKPSKRGGRNLLRSLESLCQGWRFSFIGYFPYFPGLPRDSPPDSLRDSLRFFLGLRRRTLHSEW
jgi:hypothetical protein